MPRRGLIRIAHAEVDDVLAAAACRELQLAGYVKDVRRQALDAGELFHGAAAQKRDILSEPLILGKSAA